MSDETGRGEPPYQQQQPPYQQQQQQPAPYQQQHPPPYPSRPYGAPPRVAGSGRAVAAALGAVFVIATAIVAYIAHQAPTRSYSGARVVGNSSAPSNGNSQRVVPVGTGSASTTTPYVPPPPVTTTTAAPSPPPLDPEAINRTFEGYMNALLDHDLGALHSATCPRLRHTEVGFELHGKYLRSWRGKPYEISPYASYVTVSALVGLRSPSTGASAGSATYSWYVERESGGQYYVCGFLS